MTYEQWLNEESLTDLLFDDIDDFALLSGAITPHQLAGPPTHPSSSSLQAEDSNNVRHAIPFGA